MPVRSAPDDRSCNLVAAIPDPPLAVNEVPKAPVREDHRAGFDITLLDDGPPLPVTIATLLDSRDYLGGSAEENRRLLTEAWMATSIRRAAPPEGQDSETDETGTVRS